ncbi:hypothetical protein HNR33_000517 [Brassicibacter mesophilus]
MLLQARRANIPFGPGGGTLRDRLKEFNSTEFEKWVEYHLMTCQDESLIRYSQHGLYICKKV